MHALRYVFAIDIILRDRKGIADFVDGWAVCMPDMIITLADIPIRQAAKPLNAFELLKRAARNSACGDSPINLGATLILQAAICWPFLAIAICSAQLFD